MTYDDELHATVRRDLGVAAARMTPPPPPLARTVGRSRALRRQRRAGLVAMSALVAVVAVAVAVVVSPSDEVSETVPATPPGTSVTMMPNAPLSARARPTTAWTSAGLFVWGGASGQPRGVDPGDMAGPDREDLTDGATYDPVTETWRPVADGPLSGRFGAPAAATGDSVLVAGGLAKSGRRLLSDAALYTPVTDSWTTLPSAPICPRRLVPVAGVVVAFGSCGSAALDTARFEPGPNEWVPMAESGLDDISSAYAVGEDVVVADSAGHVRRLSGGAWADEPSLPDESEGLGRIFAATPSGLYAVVYAVVDGKGGGTLLKLDGDTWTELDHGAAFWPASLDPPAAVTTGDGFMWSAQGGLCRWDGHEVSCVIDSGDLGLARFSTTYAVDGAGTAYLWGGDYIRPGDTTSSSTATGAVVRWP